MSEKEVLIEQAKTKAGDYYKSGHNCAESVLRTFNEMLQLGFPEEFYRIATGFGGGLGQAGCQCGGLSGGVMVLNLIKGRNDNKEDRMPAYKAAKELHHRFAERFGSTCCRALNPNQDYTSGEHRRRCLKITGNSAVLLMDYLLENNLVDTDKIK